MRVALVYDRVNKWGGAERVLLALHELFPNAPLYTSVYHKKKAPWAKVFIVKKSFLQLFPFASNFHEWYPYLMPFAFESFSFDDYDLVISVTSEAAKGIITKSHTIHVCYCLTPTRYLWSGYGDYFKNSWLRFFSKPVVLCLRKWDKTVSGRPDAYIAISKEVQKRIKQYYGRESEVVYPPVTIQSSKFKVQSSKKLRNNGYFLVVSRLIPYKRIDLAIEACNRLRVPLKIIGVGSDEKRLRKMAGPTIEFLGNLTDEEVIKYYMECRGLIVPGIEDFGLTVLEAQSYGKPVIAFKGGGARETIIKGKTGEFFYPQTAEALGIVIIKVQKKKFDPIACQKQAEKFSKERFKKEFIKKVEQIIKGKK